MNIIIISQNIYPAQYPRSCRATELAIQLSKIGHKVFLYSVLGKYDYENFEKSNPGLYVRNIAKMYFATRTSDGNLQKKSLIIKVLTKIFGYHLDFPDIEFMFRVPSILKQHYNTQLLLTIAMPHSIHWGIAIAKKFKFYNFPNFWIADCGDPYMGNPIIQRPFYFRYLENLFLKLADIITVPFEGAFSAYLPKYHSKIRVLPQGFRFLQSEKPTKFIPNKKITFIYSGIFYKNYRSPSIFLEFLTELNLDFKFIIYTKTPGFVTPYKIKLGNRLEIKDYIPREDLLNELSQADFLVNFDNDNGVQLPSKLIDYSISGRPILNVKNDENMSKTFFEFISGDYKNSYKLKNIEQYKIENVVNRLLSFIDGK